MEFDSVVKKRTSVREFTSKKVPWKAVLEVIDSANQSAFAGNYNNLKFIVVEDEENIKSIAKECEQEWISDVNLLLVVLSDDTHLEEKYGERGRVYSRQQAGAAIHTMLLKLVDLGLASCWVGSYNDEKIKEKLKAPKFMQVEAILPIGYAASKAKKLDKKSTESLLYWERWNQLRRPSLFEEEKTDYTHQGEILDKK